jgi:hypothetical protein
VYKGEYAGLVGYKSEDEDLIGLETIWTLLDFFLLDYK